MIDHIGFAVSDYARAKAFYAKALAPLGYTLIMEVDAEDNPSGAPAAGFGRDGKPDFWIGGEGKLEKPVHVAIVAEDRASVDAFHRAALAAGASETARRASARIIIRTITARSCSTSTATTSKPCAMRRDEVRLSVTLRSSLRFAATVALGAFAAALAASGGAAQPAPSFEAPCGEVRDALAKLAPDDEEIVTIAVRGQLTAVRSDGALVYLFLCSAPDPRILCVTYETNGVVEGDQVIVTGNLIPRGPDHIQLDPCLHHRAE